MFERILELIALELANRSIPYLIVGGQAVLVHGEPRLTRDIDVTLGVDVDRLDDLLGHALRELLGNHHSEHDDMIC